MKPRVWDVKYVRGKTIHSNSGNPFTRKNAMSTADFTARNGWRVWVEHTETKVKIYKSQSQQQWEKEHG